MSQPILLFIKQNLEVIHREMKYGTDIHIDWKGQVPRIIHLLREGEPRTYIGDNYAVLRNIDFPSLSELATFAYKPATA